MKNPVQTQSQYKQLLQTAPEIDAKIQELAGKIISTYQGHQPLFICLLRGGAPFAAKLMFAIVQQDSSFHPEMDYMTVRTYDTERSARQSELVMDIAPSTHVEDRPVVLVDDILDKGHTASFATEHLLSKGASSVDLVVLAQRVLQRDHYPSARFFGFTIETSAWLTGMGMDDSRLAKEGNRWLSELAIAND